MGTSGTMYGCNDFRLVYAFGMVQRNPHLLALKAQYLFPEINARKRKFRNNTHTLSYNLGIGDTTEPLPSSITTSLVDISKAMGTKKDMSDMGRNRG